jgi:glycerol kinase
MTRGLEHLTDATNASRTLLYDIATGDWSQHLCDLLGVPISALPSITPSYGVIAHTDPDVFLGISAPISGVAGDQQAALVGQAGFSVGDAKCTYGTGSFLLAHTGNTARMSTHGLLTTVALQHPDGHRDFALEGAIFVTGAAIQWLRDGLQIIDTAAEVEELAASVPDSGGVVLVPALTG